MDEINLMKRFESAGESALIDAEYREKSSAGKIDFGIRFLDVALGGILTSDLVLIGAKVGVGKTELTTTIATNAIAQGKRVVGFFLEAELHEVTSRIKYRAVASHFWSDPSFMMIRVTRRLNYPNWYEGKFKDILGEYEKKVSQEMAVKYKDFLVRYKAGDFTTSDMKREIMAVKDRADIIIIDHLHYVDLDAELSENKAMSELIKTMRDLSLVIGKPIVIVAHLRKADERLRKIMPSLDDFRGTGDLSGVATKAILIAPAYDKQNECTPTQYATYIQAAKYRRDGSRTRFVALCKFDTRTNSYADAYELGTIGRAKGEQVWRPVEDDKVPYWHTDKAPPKPSNVYDPNEHLEKQEDLFEEKDTEDPEVPF